MGKHEAYEGEKKIKNKTKKKTGDGKISKFGLVCRIILLLSSVFIVYEAIRLNMIPLKIMAIALAIIVGINVAEIIVLIKNKKNKAIKILSGLLALAIAAVFIFGAISIRRSTDLLRGLNRNYKTLNFSVVVKDDSEYQSIDDLENKSMGYFNNNADGMNESMSEIEKLNKGITLVAYDSLQKMGQDLLLENVDSILLEDSYKAMLDDLNANEITENTEETEEINEVTKAGEENTDKTTEENTTEVSLENFEKETRVIYTFTVTVDLAEIVKDVSVTEETFNVYISGIDTYGDIASVSRSDVNIVATINPSTKQVLLTSIPRDYYVQLHGTTGYRDKLTHAGIYGVDKSVATIEDLLDIEINYYFKFNFTSVIKIVNKIDGVDVYSDYTFTSKDGYHYTKGYNHVDGKAALSFVRERKAFKEGDRQRGKNQQAMIDAIARKCMKPSILTQYSSLLNALQDSFVTNMPAERISSLVKMQLDTGGDWTISSNSLTGADSKQYTYSYSGQQLYVMLPYQESIDNAKDLIQRVTNGEKLDGSYQESDGSSYTVVKMDLPPKREEDDEDEEEEEPTNEVNTTNEVENEVINEVENEVTNEVENEVSNETEENTTNETEDNTTNDTNDNTSNNTVPDPKPDENETSDVVTN